MVEYRYQAVDRAGRTQEGRLLAETLEQAKVKVRSELGLIPIEIAEYQPKPRRSRGMGGSKKNFVLNFSQQLANLLNAGVQVDDALSILIQLTGNDEYRARVQQIQEDIQGGADLSQALSKHPDLFNNSYISMVRAGESGGVLGTTVQRLTEYLEQDKEFRSSVSSALVYPISVLSMGLVAVVVLFIFVVPRFITMFDSLGQEMPLPTQILLAISNFFINYWYLVGIIGGIIVGGLLYYRSTPEGRHQIDQLKLKLPFIGQVTTKLTVSRFCRILGTMMESGVPLLKGLEISKSTLDNQVYVKVVENLYESVRKGGTISGFLKNEPVFPELAVFLIGVGERTGELEDMMKKVADTFANDVKKSLDRFLSLFEPVVILVLGIFVLFIVISILLPIFSMQQLSF